jgi:hypothetical protein
MSYKKQEPILFLDCITGFWFLLVSTIPAYAYWIRDKVACYWRYCWAVWPLWRLS